MQLTISLKDSNSMKYELVDCNDPVLREPTPQFDFTNPPVDPLDLVSDLAETMLTNGGVGIAANQCGLPYRVFVMNAAELIPCFNPRIVDSSSEEIYLEEGCLSYPELFVKVKRPRRIKVRYTEPNGNVVTRVFEGMTARVFQHELDHLDGLAHINRASRIHLDQARKRQKLAIRRKK